MCITEVTLLAIDGYRGHPFQRLGWSFITGPRALLQLKMPHVKSERTRSHHDLATPRVRHMIFSDDGRVAAGLTFQNQLVVWRLFPLTSETNAAVVHSLSASQLFFFGFSAKSRWIYSTDCNL